MATPVDVHRTLSIDALSNKRDLRAAVVDLAADVAVAGGKATLTLTRPRITTDAIRTEWTRIGLALVPTLRDSIHLAIEESDVSRSPAEGADSRVPLALPNYRFEVVRLLIEHALTGPASVRLNNLIREAVTSKAPIVSAVAALRLAGLVSSRGPIILDPAQIGGPTLAPLAALPQVMRFRHERGATPRTIGELLERAQAHVEPRAGRLANHRAGGHTGCTCGCTDD